MIENIFRTAAAGKLSVICMLMVCAMLVLVSAHASAELQPYKARYSVYKNGKLIGKMEVTAEALDEGRWVVHSETRGTHGLARLVRFRDDERMTGRMVDGQMMPESYDHNMRLAGIDSKWTAAFDWDDATVIVQHNKDDPLNLPLTQRAIDPMTLKLEMRERLANGETTLSFMMVDEDEISEQRFRVLPPVWLETSLGCHETVPIEKIRRSSTRYTRAWHAPSMHNVEVRVEHGKTDGDHYEMRITELTYNGEFVEPQAGCASRQSGSTTN